MIGKNGSQENLHFFGKLSKINEKVPLPGKIADIFSSVAGVPADKLDEQGLIETDFFTICSCWVSENGVYLPQLAFFHGKRMTTHRNWGVTDLQTH